MAFSCAIPVRFGDIDHAGIAYYPTLLHYCHVAFEEFFEKGLGVPYPRVFGRDRVGFPTVHLEADFRKPLSFGDRLSMEVTVARLGRGSVVFRYRARLRGAVAFEARCTTACVDARTFRPRPLPPRYRRLLTPHLLPRGA